MNFVWTEALKIKAERLYVGALKPASTVARCVGGGCSGVDVRSLAAAEGWVRPLKRADWPAEEVEAVRAAYVDRGEAPEAIARALGGKWTARKVRALASRKGWSAARPWEVTLGHKRAVLEQARPVAAAARLASARMKPPPVRRRAPDAPATVSQDLRAAIDAAIRAGKVTHLPSGRAAGLSPLESRFWAAMPAGAAPGWRRRA